MIDLPRIMYSRIMSSNAPKLLCYHPSFTPASVVMFRRTYDSKLSVKHDNTNHANLVIYYSVDNVSQRELNFFLVAAHVDSTVNRKEKMNPIF